MAKEYPYVISKITSKAKGICVLCGRVKADARVHVAVNVFRGDDNVYKVHTSCLKRIKGDDALLGAVTSPTKRELRKTSRQTQVDLLQNLCERAYWHAEDSGDYGMDDFVEEIEDILERVLKERIL